MTPREKDRFYDIFFIYHPDDIGLVRRAEAQLKALGVSCRLDESLFSKSAVDIRQLKADILRSYSVAIVLSPASAASQLCNELIQHAVNHSKRLLSLVLDEDIEVEVHPAIAANPFVYFRERDEFLDRIEELRRHLIVDRDTELHTELLVAADLWQRRGRLTELLLPADRAEEARKWLAIGGLRRPKPSALQLEYIHSSRRQRPSQWRRALGYLGLAAIALILAGVGILLAGAAISGFETAQTAAAQSRATQTQIARTAAAATAASEGAVGLVDALAATSVSIAEAVEGTEGAQALAATQSARVTQAAQAAADLRATQSRATQVYQQARAEGAARLIRGAGDALAAGDRELALALAWAAKDRLEDPAAAYLLLRRATEARASMTIDSAAILRFQPGGAQFAIVPRASQRVQLVDAYTWMPKRDLTDHQSAVTALAYSLDGKYLFTGSADGEVVIRDGATGEALQRFRRHQGAVSALAPHPQGDMLVSAGAKPLLAIWNIDTGEELAAFSSDDAAPFEIGELLVTADGGRIIGWSRDEARRGLRQWSTDTLEALGRAGEGAQYRGTDAAGTIGYSGGRSLPAYPGDPHTADLVFWDLATGEEISRLADGFNWSILAGDLTAPTDNLRSISFDEGAALLLVSRSDGAQRAALVNVRDGDVRRNFDNETIASFTAVAFLDAETALAATAEDRLLLWSLADGSLIREIGKASEGIAHIGSSAASDTVFARTRNGSAHFWRLSGASISPIEVLADAGPGTSLSPSGRNLLVVGESDIRLKAIDSREILLRLDGSQATAAGGAFVAYAEDRLEVYDSESAEMIRSWTVDWPAPERLHLAPDGEILLALNGDGMWLLRDDRAGAQRLSASAIDAPNAVIFDLQGDHFLTLHAERAVLWDVASGEPLGAYPVGGAPEAGWSAAFSADGEAIYFFLQLDGALAGLTEIAIADNAVRRQTFLDVAGGELSPDGRHLVLARTDGSIAIIQTASGEVTQQLPGPQGAAQGLRYLPGAGLLAAAAGLELTTRALPSGELDQRFPHLAPIREFAVSVDGKRILTLDQDGIYRLWQADSAEELLARVEASGAPRALTCAERETYLVTPLCE